MTRILLEDPKVELVGINDPADLSTMAHLFQYDSVHGIYPGTVDHSDGAFDIDGTRVPYLQETDPAHLPWGGLDVDVVIESSGLFLTREAAQKHLNAGAGRVLLSAPPKDESIPTCVYGINDADLDPSEKIVSNASCTTNNAAPLIDVLDRVCGVESGYITTVHAYTGDQRLHDAPHKDLRRARAAANSIVPTTTGAAKAITRIFPHLEGKMGGCGIRVPVINGSLTDITCTVTEPARPEIINQAFKDDAQGKFPGILKYTDAPLVSTDIIGDPHSCIFDSMLTSVVEREVKVVGWYDNEWGYANRLVDFIRRHWSSSDPPPA